MKFIGGMAVVVAVVAVAFMAAGCDTSRDNPHGFSGVDVVLDDGRTVTCVQNARGNVLSCDWDHAAKSYPATGPVKADRDLQPTMITSGPGLEWRSTPLTGVAVPAKIRPSEPGNR